MPLAVKNNVRSIYFFFVLRLNVVTAALSPSAFLCLKLAVTEVVVVMAVGLVECSLKEAVHVIRCFLSASQLSNSVNLLEPRFLYNQPAQYFGVLAVCARSVCTTVIQLVKSVKIKACDSDVV